MQLHSRQGYFFLILLLISLLNFRQSFSQEYLEREQEQEQEPEEPTIIEKIHLYISSMSKKPSKNTMVVDPMFMPVIFTGKILPKGYLKANPYALPKLSDCDDFVPDFYTALGMPDSFFEEKRWEQELRRKAYLYLTSVDPSIVKYTLDDLPEKVEVIEQLELNPLKNLFKVEANTDIAHAGIPEKFVFRKYWFVNGNHLLQFSQNHISENWNNGGVGNLNFLSNQNMKVNYEKNKIQFSSYFEWNMSLFTNPKDTLRATKIGTDLLRSYSNFGFRAFGKQWFYSSNLELKTQVFNNYKENTQTKISSFISPFSLNMGILGMRYELDKKFQNNKYKSYKLSVDYSPLSVKYTYVGDSAVDPTRYGIEAGKNSQTDFGSTVNATLNYNISRAASLKSRFKYFTNFEKVEVESENEVIFSINRYFSTRLYLYLRYDDCKKLRDPKLGYFQINELLSFGFNYKW